MPKPRKSRAPKTIFQKIEEIAPEWLDGIMSAKTEFLKDKMVELELQDKEIEEAKSTDTDLITRVEQAKIAKETYSVPLNLNKLKRRAIAVILEERGKA